MTTLRFAACLPLILALCACNSDAPPDTSGHQSAAASSDDDEPDAADHQTPADAVDREAVRQFVERGTDAIPELKQQLEHADPGQRLVARVALAKITGQWGWEDGLVWCRSVEDATRQSAERRAARLREIEATPDSAEPDEHLRLLMDGDGTMTGTPLLVLHLFGQFDEEFCWANGKLARTVTFSDARVCSLIREHFVPAWESVAPVKVAVFHLGDGRTARGTVGGEIALYFCRPDGKVFDILPALHSPHVTYWAIKNALAFYRTTGATDEAILAYHAQLLEQRSQTPDEARAAREAAHAEMKYRVRVPGGTAALSEMAMSKTGMVRPAETIIVVEPGGRELYKTLIHEAFVKNGLTLRTPAEWKPTVFEQILDQKLQGGETEYDVNTLAPMSLDSDE